MGELASDHEQAMSDRDWWQEAGDVIGLKLYGFTYRAVGSFHDPDDHGATVNLTGKVAKRLLELRAPLLRRESKMETDENYVGLLSIIAGIREASGLGAKPMLTELPGAIQTLLSKYAHERDQARQQRDEANANVAKLLTAAREDFELMKDTAHTVQSLTARATAAEARVAQLETALKEAGDEFARIDCQGWGSQTVESMADAWHLVKAFASRGHRSVSTALSQSTDREGGV